MDGVWRTIGGRRVFIAEGDDLKSAMEKSGKFGGEKWTYPGIDNQVTKIEKEIANVKSARKAIALRIAIDAQDGIISKELDAIKQGNANGDENALLSYRRRLRIAKKTLISKEIL